MLLNLIVLYLRVIKPKRVKFGTWIRLEKLVADIDKAVEKDITQFSKLVIEYVSTALFIPTRFLVNVPWKSIILLFYLARTVNNPKKIPLLLSNGQKQRDNKTLGWDYDGRTLTYWSHILAKAYGWELEYIWGLDIDVALALTQEIYTDEQLDREFLWSMSEIAYPYNPSTKQSKFSPLARPYFMQQTSPEIKIIKIRRDMLPMGNINNVSGMEDYVKAKTKEVELIGND